MRNMRILILVLSYNQPPYSDFMLTQMATWDSVTIPGVDTCYYYGGGKDEYIVRPGETSMRLEIATSDAYENMHWKFKRALDAVPYHKYDYVFRTNSCSYVHKKRLLKIAKSLPAEFCYAGWDNIGYVSGAGIFLSPDVCERLRHALTEDPHGAEDVLIGSLLKGHVPIKPLRDCRTDVGMDGSCRTSGFHWRFKTSNDPADRYRDVVNMRKLHRRLYKL